MTAQPPWSSFITLEDIYGLYREGIRRYGGDASNPKPGCVESSVAAAWNAESYTDAEQSGIPGLVFAGYLLLAALRKRGPAVQNALGDH